MICSDIWHKYQECYFEIVIRNFNLRQFWNIMSGIFAKYHVQIMLLFVYTTTPKRFVIFTCRYFKLSWDTTALSQSNCRNFSSSSIIIFIYLYTLRNSERYSIFAFCFFIACLCFFEHVFANAKNCWFFWRCIWRDGQFEKSFLMQENFQTCVRAFPMLVNKSQL